MRSDMRWGWKINRGRLCKALQAILKWFRFQSKFNKAKSVNKENGGRRRWDRDTREERNE